MVKKKVPSTKTKQLARLHEHICSQESENGGEVEVGEGPEETRDERRPPFRNPNFQHSSQVGKKKAWRSLKPILAHERSLLWPKDPVLYSTIAAPPRFNPAKKYSDISGSEAKYTDPQTKLFFANPDEFATVRSLPSDIIAGYLALRGAINPIG